MTSTTNELNWAKNYRYAAGRILQPDSLDQVAELVAREPRVRGLGTRHSFTDVADVADGEGTLLDLTALPIELEIDAHADGGAAATVNAGARYGIIAPTLDAEGVALHNMGSLPHISIAGATATGTHGSGSALGSLSTAVRAIEFVGADGSLRTVARGDRDFGGVILHLGLLGVVTRLTLDVEPTFRMRQDAYGSIPWATFLENVEAIFASGYSVCCFTNWDGRVRETLVKSRVPQGATELGMPPDIAGAAMLPGVAGDDKRTARDGSIGPWWDRLPHFTIESVPSVGDELQSEHFVPLRHAAAALDAVNSLAGRIQPHLHVTELRTMAADELWLSPSQGEDVLCIAFTWQKHPADVAALLPDLEAALAPFGGRPHWGKLSSLDAAAIGDLYPRLTEFRALVAQLDPDRKFASSLGERLLGV